jgi:hypothetical protein
MNDETLDAEATLPPDDSRPTARIGVGAAPPLHLLKDLARLAGDLGRIQEKAAAALDEADGTIAPVGSALAAIEAALARVELKVDSLSAARSPGVLDAVLMRLSALLGEAPRPGLMVGCPDPGETVRIQPEPEAAGEWGRIIFGDDLWSDPAIAADRLRLLEGFLAREPAACALAAQLLLFQWSPPARIPTIVKDLGEAYYQWQPQDGDGDAPLEAALARWVVRFCEAIGLGHHVELVRPGSRYDPQRHRSQDRGVEVIRALGWVLLRDDGSVFQKANVAVR